MKKISLKDCKVSYSRSGGPGGQNVNKSNNKVTLVLQISKDLFTSKEVCRLKENFQKGKIVVSNSESRSQRRNLKNALQNLNELVEEVLKEEKERKETTVPLREKNKRMKDKRHRKLKKFYRKRIF